jgi:hypothetical protein
MYIKIIKSSSHQYWYNDKVGQTFKLVGETFSGDYKIHYHIVF